MANTNLNDNVQERSFFAMTEFAKMPREELGKYDTIRKVQDALVAAGISLPPKQDSIDSFLGLACKLVALGHPPARLSLTDLIKKTKGHPRINKLLRMKQHQPLSQGEKAENWLEGNSSRSNALKFQEWNENPDLPLAGQRLRAAAIDHDKESFQKLMESGVVARYTFIDPASRQIFSRYVQIRTIDIPLGLASPDMCSQLSFMPMLESPLPPPPAPQKRCA